jgi:hypothetical protein
MAKMMGTAAWWRVGCVCRDCGRRGWVGRRASQRQRERRLWRKDQAV